MAKFTYRFLIYGVITLYILLDLQVFKGPMHTWMMTKRGKDPAALRAEGVAATVYGQAIYESQVEYRMKEYLYTRGRSIENLTEKEHPLIFRHCLEILITEHLIRIKTHYNQGQLNENPALEQEIKNDTLQFSDRYEREDALRRQGYEEGELALRAEAHLQQREYLNLKIKKSVTPEELASLTSTTSTIPERIKIRHLFLSTWEKPPEEVKQALETLVNRLKEGESFKALSDEYNDDARAKKNEGLLDWVTQERLPSELKEPLFSMNTGDKGILKSKLGWHYIEVIEKKAVSKIPANDQEAEAYLENIKRKEGLKLYLQQLREREVEKVKIYWQAPK